MKPTLARLTKFLVCAALPAFLLMGAGARVFAQPAVVPSFGPNGTHWPLEVPTPFIYDASVPHKIEVDCTWAAIKTALNGVTEQQASEGVIILVKPGSLETGAVGSSSGGVIDNAGNSAWTKRVTVAPRDGYGSVTIGTAGAKDATASITNIRKVCFVGIPATVLRMVACEGSALAWVKLGKLYLHQPAGAAVVTNMEFTEVVIDPLLIWDDRVPSGSGEQDTCPVAILGRTAIDGLTFTGCYIAPSFKNNAGTIAYVVSPVAGLTTGHNTKITDTAIFGSNSGALKFSSEPNGISIKHSYLAGGNVSLTRYPVPSGYPSGNTTHLKNAFYGTAQNITVENSVVEGGATIAALATDLTGKPFASVINTKANPIYTEAVQLPATGAWGVPDSTVTTADDIIALMPLFPTDAYLASIWANPSTPLTFVTELPEATSGNTGIDIVLTVEASDTVSVTYVWKKGDTVIPGAEGASYTITNPTAADSGTYSVTVTKGSESITSTTVVTISAAPVPVIGTQPAATTNVVAGSDVTLTVTATNPGTGTLAYQWYKDETLLTGKTTDTLTITTAMPADSGTYSVKVTNNEGTTTSNNAVVTVTGSAPTISTQPPASSPATAGAATTLTASISGSPAPTVVWQLSTDGGITWNDILTSDPLYSGANSASLTILNPTVEMDGFEFRYKITNLLGDITSGITILEVSVNTLYRPTVVPSFGPNGTHWPSQIPTPFMYDSTVTHVIKVACDWGAIKTAINSVTAQQADEGVLILVAEGDLLGANITSNENSSVISGAGDASWTKRVTVAPEKGYGSVRVVASLTPAYADRVLEGARITGVNKVCFAGFIAKGFCLASSDGSALAWSKTGRLYMHSVASRAEPNNVEIVEVLIDPILIFANRYPTATAEQDTSPVAFFNRSSFKNAYLTGCYIAPSFRNNSGSFNYVDPASGDYPATNNHNITITDSAIFGSASSAIKINSKPDGLTIRNSYVVSGEVSLSRYPKPTEAPSYNGYAFQGSGKNIIVENSVVAGIIALTNAAGSENPFSSVTATKVDQDPLAAPSTLGIPLAGGWGMPVGTLSTTTDLIALMPPDPTDAYLEGIWAKPPEPLAFVTALPATTSGNEGTDIVLTVEVNETISVTYEWKKGATVIPSATGASYTITNPTTGDSGTYSVTVTKGSESITSSTVVTVAAALPKIPVIGTQPAATTNVIAGTTVMLTVAATNPVAGTLAYQWYKGATLLTGKTTDTLTLTSAMPADSGTYSVKITNTEGTATSDNAVVTVTGSAPTIPTPLPPSRPVTAGVSTTLTASISGSPAPTVLWQVSTDGGITWNDILTSDSRYSGADTASLTILNPTVEMDGWEYRYKITNLLGDLTSGSTVIEVGVNTLYSPSAVGSFGPNGTHWPSVIPTPFMYDITVPHVIKVECTWEAIAAAISSVTAQQADEGVIILVAEGNLVGKGIGSNSTTNVLAWLGDPAWSKRVTVAPEKGYGTVKVVTEVGSNTLQGARFEQVKNVCFAGFVAKSICMASCDGSALAWTKTGHIYVHSAADAGASANVEFVEVLVEPALVFGASRIVTATSNWDVASFALFNRSQFSGLRLTGCYIVPAFSAASAVPNTLYFHEPGDIGENNNGTVITDSALFASTESVIKTDTRPDGLTINHSYVVAANVSKSRYPEPSGAGRPTSLANVWQDGVFRGQGKNFVVNDSIVAGLIELTTNAAPKPFSNVTNTLVDRVYTASAQLPVAGAWGVPAGSASTVAALTVLMPVDPTDAYLDSIWKMGAPVVVTSLAPSYSLQANQNLTLSIAVDSAVPVTYQWKKDDTVIVGATGSSYSITNATLDDAGVYYVTVTNAAGSVTVSTQVLIGENPAQPLPVITQQPAAFPAAEVLAGTPVTLTVAAQNNPPAVQPLTYQWRKNQVAITGANSTTLSLTGAPDDAGAYDVLVANEFGTRRSGSVTITITGAAPSIFAPLPSGKIVVIGDDLSLSASAQGTPTPTLQWQVSTNGGLTWQNISGTDPRYSGATATTLVFENITLDMNGWIYRYVATNPFASVESGEFTLTVNAERMPFPRPVEVTSFGPNGTHWPSTLSTPFMYDITIPHRIQVACSWTAIRDAVQALTDDQVEQGVLILVASGTLEGYGGGSTATPVLQNLGKTTWQRRITIAPAEGYGAVVINGSTDSAKQARINQVHGVCFAGFTALRITMTGCINSALAWTKTETLAVNATNGGISKNVEVVEVVMPVVRHGKGDDTSGVASSQNGGDISEIYFIGCYTAPSYRLAASDDHTDTLQFYAGSGATTTYTNMFFRDSAWFGSNNTAIQTGSLVGLKIEHCYIVSADPSWARYPFAPGDDNGAGQATKAFNGAGLNFEAYDSIFIGRDTLTRINAGTPVWARVENSQVDQTTYSAPAIGSWTHTPSLGTSNPDDYLPVPTDTYLNSIWLPTVPVITTQPAAYSTINPGSSTEISVAAEGTVVLAYQWYKNGVEVPGAIDRILRITNANAGSSGIYTVKVTNAAGSVTSENAVLSVTVDDVVPGIGINPVATQNAVAGKSVSLSGSATGNPAPSYQWQISTNGVTWTNIDPSNADYTGANTDTLTIVNPTTAMNGYRYRYVATNAIGSVDSDPATLSVATAAFILPVGIVSDAAGMLYVSDAGAHTIHRLTSTGTLQVIAGASGTAGMVDGLRAEALLNTPTGLAVRSGTLYIADAGNSAIRGLTGSGTVTTIIASTAGLKNAEGVAVAADGTIYIADTGNHVIRAYASGVLITLAGSLNTTGTTDGAGAAALFNRPTRLALSPGGTMLYVADTGNNAIRVITPADGNVITIADNADGLYAPSGLLVSGTGAATIVYVANTGNSTISEIAASDGTVSTLAGYGGIDDIAGPPGFKDGVDQAAWFNLPEDVTVGTDGALYVADTGNTVIRKITFDASDNATAATLKPAVKPVEPPPVDIGPFDPGSSSAAGGAPSAWYLMFLGAIVVARRALLRRDRN